jgi:hypothetical protein
LKSSSPAAGQLVRQPESKKAAQFGRTQIKKSTLVCKGFVPRIGKSSNHNKADLKFLYWLLMD